MAWPVGCSRAVTQRGDMRSPKRYIVLNSGFTFREYDQLNNARQVPKLPDFAIVNVNVPVSSRAPGGIADAGFFGENWALPKESK